MKARLPAVLCFSGHDPSGGAGVQADIETIRALGCHACSVLTALTEQDTHNVKRVFPQPAERIARQAETLLADMPVAAVKIGLLAHAETALAVAEIMARLPGVPLVLDPVLAAGGGADLADNALLDAVRGRLLPLARMVTPNSHEARRLAGVEDLRACGRYLLDKGAEFALLTGAHEPGEEVRNLLFFPNGRVEASNWRRLPGEFHGSGCTLASAVAALLAQGLDEATAAHEAQDFTWQALQAAYPTGSGQANPDRLFWSGGC